MKALAFILIFPVFHPITVNLKSVGIVDGLNTDIVLIEPYCSRKEVNRKMADTIETIQLHEAARRRYLTYALSVIQSRALPDVRDGLKPVQRRILFTGYQDLHILPGRPARKCATMVGRVLGNYHPHGDQAVYDTLVRMAQHFSMRYPLIEGIGNFGSLDGDPPAAYRYTECRLTPIAIELLAELNQETVMFRPTFDGQNSEPLVMPSRFPNLLANGTTGIAVGMATNIPPHNLKELLKTCIALIDDPDLPLSGIMRYLKGPDFPTGGEIIEDKATIREVYKTGTGAIRVQGEYKIEEGKRGARSIIVTSVPYQTNKAQIVADIGQIAAGRKVPQLVDVRDESTDEVRVVLDLKRGADPELVMAYVYRHTALRTRFNVNMTCLVPTDDDTVVVPRRIGLKEMLEHFLEFRFQVVKRKLEYRLRVLKERIHILEGFRKIFNHLSEAIRIIRQSDGRQDAHVKLKKRFKLDDIQVNAILETKLYRLAKLEIKKILDELKAKREEARKIEQILKSRARLWRLVKKEFQKLLEEYGDRRRTKIAGEKEGEVSFSEEDFIAHEDTFIIATRDGWVKRMGRVNDPGKIRTRQGDSLLAIVPGNTRSVAVFFSNFGSAYSIRINDIPQSRGYGDPIQRLCKFRDGEKLVAVVSMDERFLEGIKAANGGEPKTHALAVSTGGYGLRFSLEGFAEVSTKTGRKYARLKKDEEIAGVVLIHGDEVLCCASRGGRALLCQVGDVNFLAGPGRGVKVINLTKGDRLLGFAVTTLKTRGLTVISKGGRKHEIAPGRYRVTSRAGRGFPLTKRTQLTEVVKPPVAAPSCFAQNGNGKD